MANSDSGQTEQKIYTFSFQTQGRIAIPKNVRELAFTQAVDFIARTSSISMYRNGKAEPPIEFYGYATIVLEDCLALEIPLRFPRQRIWSMRNEQALTVWKSIPYWYWLKSTLQGATAPIWLESEEAYPSFSLPESGFIELPLRAVYIRTLPFCGFDIEYSQDQPVSYVDNDGTTVRGESKQEDGRKDGGLPTSGINPRQTSPNDPYDGQPNNGIPTFENGWFTPPVKTSGDNPDNGYPDDFGYFAEFTYTGFNASTCETYGGKSYYLISSEDTLSFDVLPDVVEACGKQGRFVKLIASVSGLLNPPQSFVDTWSAAIVRSASLPPNIVN